MRVSSDYQPALASGKAPWWKITRPRLAAPDSLLATPAPSSGELAASDTVTGVARWKRPLLRAGWTIAGILTAGIAAAAVLWIILAVTILPTPSIGGDRYVVKWATWPQGQAPVDAIAVIDTAPISNDLGTRFQYAVGSDSLSVVTITGGVIDAVKRDPELREDHYVVSCLAGECQEGEFLVPVNHVMGEVLGQYRPPFTVEQVQVAGQPVRGAM